ncbi:hypothetical protein C4J81_01505 [Deltaproteobacteria bacterium Smac51]|nr:hypothetical protein C4J81_01505 [Deltaproteobacteria bacterium Smac51]
MKDKLPDDVSLDAIHTNLVAQEANNEARIRELRRYAMEGFAFVFDQAPLLLNVNSPEQPGYINDPATPYGVRFIERQSWLSEEHRHDSPLTRPVDNPAVESLLLIGSSGSVGHTASSDLDYWVCYEPERLNGRPLELFQQKLAAISDWARREHGTEANFYIINLKELAAGRITRLDEAETEGEVAPLLLLEELYRTILHVAGRPAVWQLLPTGISREKYQALSDLLTSGESAQFVDLGFPALPAPQEFLAAALWLARKSEADPFKGIMKIISILEYVESDFQMPLLCNDIKSAILKAIPAELPVDPYVLAIDRITEYGARSLTPEQLDLLRTAAALKVLGSTGSGQVFVIPKNSPKRLILEERATRWGWDEDRIMRLTNYSRWPERERLYLGGELLNMLSSVYVRISHYLISNYPGQVNPQDEELAPLAARLLARRGGLDSTIETLPSQMHRLSIASRLVIIYDPDSALWNLHALDDSAMTPSDDNLVYAAGRAIRLGAWLVHNQVLRPETIVTVGLSNAPDGLTDEHFLKIMDCFKRDFPPLELVHEDTNDLWSAGGQSKVLVVLNFEAPHEEAKLLSADYILRTGWGEMRHFYVDVTGLPSSADQYLKIAQSLLREGNARPENLVFQCPDTPLMHKSITNIRAALVAKKRHRPDEKKSRIDI